MPHAARPKVLFLSLFGILTLFTQCVDKEPKTLCSGSCPKNFHKAANTCSPTCGTDCTKGPNAFICEYDSAAPFSACDDHCPSGYTNSGPTCDNNCGDCKGVNNAVSCQVKAPPPDTQPQVLTSCSPCPSGYHDSARQCTSQCGVCIGPTNTYICTQNVGDSFTSCTSCPAGYHDIRQQCTSECGVCIGPTNNYLCIKN